jgi:hypothetical protein
MKKTIFVAFSAIVMFWLSSLMLTIKAQTITICKGEYALCAASPTTLTGKTITVSGKTFKEGVAVCPVLTGAAVANMDLMQGSCNAPKGKVWSLFGVPPQTAYPQAPDWSVQPAVFRSFKVGDTPTTGMSNMWSFLCTKQTKQVNGVTLASCYGPVMESPWTGNHVVPGETAFTQAPVGASYPVGGNVP